MIRGLKITQQLVLVVRVLGNNLDKINVSLDNLNEEVVTHLEAPPYLLLLVIQGSDPGLKQGSQDAQIIAPIADLFHVTAQNDPRTQTNLLGKFSQLLVVDNTAQNPRHEALSLTRVALGQIGGHAETKDAVPEKFQFLIVVFAQRQTALGPFRQHGNVPLFGLLLPHVGPVHVRLVNACARKYFKVTEAPFPSVFLKNRDRIRGSEFPILWIPRNK